MAAIWMLASGVSEKPPMLVYVMPDDEQPEELAALNRAILNGNPIVVWRVRLLDGRPLPTMLNGYGDVLVLDGDYDDVMGDLMTYARQRGYLPIASS